MSMEVIEVFGSEIVSGTREVEVIEFAPSGPQGIPGTGGSGAVSSVNSRTGAVVLTSADVGLANVDNTADASKPVSTAQAAADTAVLASANATTAAHSGRTDNPHNVSAAQIGLGDVENKSSATIRSEITSGNVTTALGYAPENAAQKGAAGGYAPLDGTGKVASTYLPSYVDDVLEFANLAGFPVTGETGKMYVALDTNKVYRWSGSAYVEISGSPGSTDAVPEGASNLYFTAARVLATVLSGLSTATNAVITAADTVLSALGKLQKQISDNLTTLTSHTSNTSNPHNATAAQVGAVAKAGDTMTGALNWATTQTIASAATTDIGAATSNSVIVSGTTTITALGTIAAGAERVVQFSGALTLTHNATSLILPGGASITTAAGDVAYFVSLGSGNWRCTGYQKANGQAVVASVGGSSNTRWLGAGEFIPRVTNGAGIDGQEFSTNRQNLDYLAFDPGTQEFAQASFDWPSGYTTFTATFYWTAASGSGAVVWRAAARCYADGDAIDQAFGTAQSVTDTLITATNNHASSATSAVTPSGTVSAGNLCVVQIDRDATNGSDTLAVDGRLIGVRLVFA